MTIALLAVLLVVQIRAQFNCQGKVNGLYCSDNLQSLITCAGGSISQNQPCAKVRASGEANPMFFVA